MHIFKDKNSNLYERLWGGKTMKIKLLIIMLTAINVACITIKTVNVGQKTALEHQLMGRFEPLTDEQMGLAAVRAGDGNIENAKGPEYLRALNARKRQIFNADDIEHYKNSSCLGEALVARLTLRPCDQQKEEKELLLLEKLISQENDDRKTLLDWLILNDPRLDKTARQDIQKIYHDMLVERAQKRAWYQNKKGVWQQK